MKYDMLNFIIFYESFFIHKTTNPDNLKVFEIDDNFDINSKNFNIRIETLTSFVERKKLSVKNGFKCINDQYGLFLITKKNISYSEIRESAMDGDMLFALHSEKEKSPITVNDLFYYVPRKVLIKKIIDFNRKGFVDIYKINKTCYFISITKQGHEMHRCLLSNKEEYDSIVSYNENVTQKIINDNKIKKNGILHPQIIGNNHDSFMCYVSKVMYENNNILPFWSVSKWAKLFRNYINQEDVGLPQTRSIVEYVKKCGIYPWFQTYDRKNSLLMDLIIPEQNNEDLFSVTTKGNILLIKPTLERKTVKLIDVFDSYEFGFTINLPVDIVDLNPNEVDIYLLLKSGYKYLLNYTSDAGFIKDRITHKCGDSLYNFFDVELKNKYYDYKNIIKEFHNTENSIQIDIRW